MNKRFELILYVLIILSIACHVLSLDSRHTIKKLRRPRLKINRQNSKEERKSDKIAGSKSSSKDDRKVDKNIFINTWAVRVVGDDFMAQKVANDYGFVYKGKVSA